MTFKKGPSSPRAGLLGHKPPSRALTPCFFGGPINGERFRAYVDQFLTRTLKPGDVILENLGSHKRKAVPNAIRDVRSTPRVLRKYSPDFDPIEQVFAKFRLSIG